jgi:hypothetical protein
VVVVVVAVLVLVAAAAAAAAILKDSCVIFMSLGLWIKIKPDSM